MTQRTGNTSKRPSFADVKSAALENIDRVLSHWLPNGKRVDGGKEYTAPNPTRTDKRAGSLKVNLSKGTWADFATGDKGGDLIDLVRYIDGGTDVEACKSWQICSAFPQDLQPPKAHRPSPQRRNGSRFSRSRSRP